MATTADASTPDQWDRHSFCYVTTKGRRTSNPHTIEIWFAAHHAKLYLLSGAGKHADWVRNIEADPNVQVCIGQVVRKGRGLLVADPQEDAAARRMLAAKYEGWTQGPLSDWAESALLVAIELG